MCPFYERKGKIIDNTKREWIMDDFVTDEERACEYAVRARQKLVLEILQGYKGKIRYEVNKYGQVHVQNSRVDILGCWDIEYHNKNKAMHISIMDDNDFKKTLKILFECDDNTCEKYINEMIAKDRIISFNRS